MSTVRPTSVSHDITRRLLYGKYLLFQAKRAQAEPNELGVAISLLLMHDACEMVMRAVSDHLQLEKWDKFMDFWPRVKKLQNKELGHRSRSG